MFDNKMRIQRNDLLLVALCLTIMDCLFVFATTAFLLGGEVTTIKDLASVKLGQRNGFLSNAKTTVTNHRMALGDFTVELEKPLGIILEELDENGR